MESTDEKKEIKGKPMWDNLDHDSVFMYLKTNVSSHYEVMGGKIFDKKTAGPKEPRTIIRIFIKNRTGQLSAFDYNYKKIERMMKDEMT